MRIGFSHIGIVVKNIREFGGLLERLFGCRAVSDVVEDPAQEACLQMFRSGDTLLECIAPAGESSPVHTALRNHGEGCVHLCFETDDLDVSLAQARAEGAVVFKKPIPARLFGGKRVAFLMLPNRMIIEFVEAGWRDALAGSGG